jgi:hypothetical protein
MKSASIVMKTLVVLFCFAAGVQASVQVGDLIKVGDGPGSPGGIFYVDDLNDAEVFDSFCVEIEERINFTEKYAVEAINTQTNQTGKPLTDFVAWLYTEYTSDSLLDFADMFASNPEVAANTLQLAIWKGMGYTKNAGSGWYDGVDGYIKSSWYDTYNNDYTKTLAQDLVSGIWESEFNADVTSGAWSGIGNVRIMNLRKVNSDGSYGGYVQDQLVIIPEPISVVVWSLLGVSIGAVLLRRERAC